MLGDAENGNAWWSSDHGTLAVRNIPKFKDRANWSRDTFQPMRRRVCVYQQTNQNIAVIKTAELVRIGHRFEALRHIFKTFHEAYTIF